MWSVASLEKTSANSKNSLGRTIGGFAFSMAAASSVAWGSQDEVGVSLNDPVKSLISFGLGNELVLSLVV